MILQIAKSQQFEIGGFLFGLGLVCRYDCTVYRITCDLSPRSPDPKYGVRTTYDQCTGSIQCIRETQSGRIRSDPVKVNVKYSIHTSTTGNPRNTCRKSQTVYIYNRYRTQWNTISVPLSTSLKCPVSSYKLNFQGKT